LAATAIERKPLAAVAADDFAQFGGDLRDGRVPVDRVKAAIGAAAQRRGQPVAGVRIEVNARSLVAEISLRVWVVAAPRQLADALVFNQILEAVIDVAEIAGGLAPVGARHGHLFHCGTASVYMMIIIQSIATDDPPKESDHDRG